MLKHTTSEQDSPDTQENGLHCGAELMLTCQDCAQTLPVGSKYCMHCGAHVSPGESKPATFPNANSRTDARALVPPKLATRMHSAATKHSGERREVTVLFLDSVDFTSASRELDNEDVYLVIDEVMRLSAEVIFKYEGTIDKFTGDGLMALFGAPIAHENDPERAVRAALEIQEVLRTFRSRARDRYGFDFQARLGINTGSVIAGRLGNDLHLEYTVIGDTVNLASRLESAAKPGTILVSLETYQRTRPIFHYEITAPLQVKGFSDPIIAAQPISLLTKPDRVRGLPGIWVPMVGRADALEGLLQALHLVTTSHEGHVALVTGDAGMGKSRLVAEFYAQIDQEAIPHFEGQCLNYARSQLFWVVADMVRQVFHVAESDPASVQMTTLRTQLRSFGLPEIEVLPYLIHVLRSDTVNTEYRQIIDQFDADMLQRQTHQALYQVFKAGAQDGPVVFVFEDIHWIDPASRDFLTYLIRNVDNLPIFLVFVSRRSAGETEIQSLIQAARQLVSHYTEIQLQCLSSDEAEQMVDELIGQSSLEISVVKKQIVARAEGNPFYIEELLRMLVDHGGLIGRPGVWQFTTKASTVLQLLPGTIKGLILTRFDRLDDALRIILHEAAVLGRSFPFRLLQHLSGTDPEELNGQLNELVAKQFLIHALVDKPDWYSFQHALIQETIYDTLLKCDRESIHLQVANAIETGNYWPADDQAESLAHHFIHSNEPARATPWLIKAAQNATNHSINQAAANYYRQALKLVTRKDSIDLRSTCELHLGLAQSLKFIGEFAEARSILESTLAELPALDQGKDSEPKLLLTINVLRELADVCAREGLSIRRSHISPRPVSALTPLRQSAIPGYGKRYKIVSHGYISARGG